MSKVKTVEVTIIRNGSLCVIPVPFDPEATFGKVRAPVNVTVNGYTFRSTICRMHGNTFVPFRKSNREPARIHGGERVKVRFAADTENRTIEPPTDLAQALKKRPGMWQCWRKLSYTTQRESVEAVLCAKRPETRSRRIAGIVALVEERLKSG